MNNSSLLKPPLNLSVKWRIPVKTDKTKSPDESTKLHPHNIERIGTSFGEEELECFEQGAKCACAHGGSKRGPKRKGLKLEFEPE